MVIYKYLLPSIFSATMELLDNGVLAAAVTRFSSLGRNGGGAAHNIHMENDDSSFDLSDYFLADDDAPLATAQPEIDESAPFEQNFVPPAVTGNNTSDALPPLPRMEEGSRIAFRTQTDEENLDDGFKWRKYGKKSVKNSPNPRNYYRCSTEGCLVKKRVERDREDPSFLLSTYEGIHNHSSPGVVYYATQDSVSGRFLLTGSQVQGPGSSSTAASFSSLS